VFNREERFSKTEELLSNGEELALMRERRVLQTERLFSKWGLRAKNSERRRPAAVPHPCMRRHAFFQNGHLTKRPGSTSSSSGIFSEHSGLAIGQRGAARLPFVQGLDLP
jgi:hypothetical protein